MINIWNGGYLFIEQVYKDDPEFDEDCRDVIETRMIEHSYDYRLNPELHKACREDVEKHCSTFLMHDYSVSRTITRHIAYSQP
jgi:hypothetical protein